MIRTLSDSEIWELVDACPYAHLGCSRDGKTYVVPVSFVRSDNRILGMTSEGMKIEMMRQNPEVCLQFEKIDSLTQWRSAILWGRFEELSLFERTRVAGSLFDKYEAIFVETGGAHVRERDVTPPRIDNEPKPMIAYAITITETSGRAEGQ